MKYNFENIPETYHNSLAIILDAGYKPIAVCTMMCEETFYFETIEDAQKAYDYFEVQTKCIQGWWYSISSLEENNKFYQDKFLKKAPTIYFLNHIIERHG